MVQQIEQWNKIEVPEMIPHAYGHLIFDKGIKSLQWKKEHFQQIVLIQLAVNMQKNVNQSILISLYKTQVKMDEGLPHKTRYSENNRKESGEEPQAHGHRGKFPEENTNSFIL